MMAWIKRYPANQVNDDEKHKGNASEQTRPTNIWCSFGNVHRRISLALLSLSGRA
jgi:hypothetical protein